jgi:hypothetical protein
MTTRMRFIFRVNSDDDDDHYFIRVRVLGLVLWVFILMTRFEWRIFHLWQGINRIGEVWVFKNGLYNLGKEMPMKNTYHQLMNSTNMHF